MLDPVNVGELTICKEGQTALIEVHGKGSFQNAGLLKKATSQLFDEGIRFLFINLGQCGGMDSTFLGILAGVGQKLKQTSGRMALQEVTGRNLELVQNMGLDHFMSVTEEAAISMDSSSCLSVSESDSTKKEATALILEAHKNLIQIDPRNRDKFQDVVDYLERSAAQSVLPG